jgi:hypothetical protein
VRSSSGFVRCWSVFICAIDSSAIFREFPVVKAHMLCRSNGYAVRNFYPGWVACSVAVRQKRAEPFFVHIFGNAIWTWIVRLKTTSCYMYVSVTNSYECEAIAMYLQHSGCCNTPFGCQCVHSYGASRVIFLCGLHASWKLTVEIQICFYRSMYSSSGTEPYSRQMMSQRENCSGIRSYE